MMGSRYSAFNGGGKSRAREDDKFETTRNTHTAVTPGFFESRARRNNSVCPASGVMSKTFENYIRARERAELVAKEKIDKLNKMALNKIKH
jgi:hypothetical protein